MNRHRWFLTVMAMVVGVALAGPAMGTNHFIKKLQKDSPLLTPVPKPAPGPAPIKAVTPPLLWVVSMNLKNDKRPGDGSFSQISFSSYLELGLTQGGNYTVSVRYTNPRPVNSKVVLGTLVVERGYTPKEYHEKSLPIIAPYGTHDLSFPLGSIGGTVSDKVQIKITAGWKELP